MELKAIKLYNPNFCQTTIALGKDLPLPTTARADPNKGELWITLDQLEKRCKNISSLYSKNMYKSVFQLNKTLIQPAFKLFLKQYSKIKFAFKVHINEPSTFMINLFILNDKTKNRKFCVFTADTERRKIKLNHELIKQSFYQQNPKKGEAKVKIYQKFELQPNKYIFQNFNFISKTLMLKKLIFY